MKALWRLLTLPSVCWLKRGLVSVPRVGDDCNSHLTGLPCPSIAPTSGHSPQSRGQIFVKVWVRSHHFRDHPWKASPCISITNPQLLTKLSASYPSLRSILQTWPLFVISPSSTFSLSTDKGLPRPWSSLCLDCFLFSLHLASSHSTWGALWFPDQITLSRSALLQHLALSHHHCSLS